MERFLKLIFQYEVGIGEGSDGLYDSDGKLLKLMSGNVYPMQVGVSTIVKLTRWFGVHLQGGERLIFGQNMFQNQYSGLYYTFGINLNFGTIYRDFVQKPVGGR